MAVPLEETIKKAGNALRNGKPGECVDLLAPLVAASENGLDPSCLCQAADLIARAKWSQGLHGEALQIWRDCLARFQGFFTDVAAYEIPLLCNLAHGLLEVNEPDKALAQALTAVEKYHNSAEMALESGAFALFTLSSVYYRLKELEKAGECALEAKELWEKAGNREKAATCMNNLGRINEELGNLEQGVLWHQKAVAERRLLPDRLDLAFSLGNLGVALAQLNQWRLAADALSEALAIYAALGMAESREYQGYRYNLEICKQALNQ